MVDESNAAAIGRTLAALEAAGRLEEVDAAEVQMLRSLAAAVDVRPHSPGLWQQYREALGGVRSDGGDDDDLQDLLERLSSPVGDSSET